MKQFLVPYPILEEVLPNGLHLTIVQRKDHHHMSAQFAFPFGSLHEAITDSKGNRLEITAGMAHFLEHQLFRQSDGSSSSDAFAALGAYDNAFTNFDHTVYMADCSDHQMEVLQLLLDFTDQPCFVKESVDNEREIIIQELMMYRDQPEERLELNLRHCLYGDHRAGQDIGGEPETVALVTAELLYQCYEAYYQPTLARLVVVGDMEPAAVAHMAAQWGIGRKINYQPVQPTVALQPGAQSELTLAMRAARPLLALGFADDRQIVQSGKDFLRRQLEMDLILDMICGKSSAIYWEFTEKELFSSYFSADYSATPWFGAVSCSADSTTPKELQERLLQYFRSGEALAILTTENLQRMKKKTLGELLGCFESGEALAVNLLTANLYGYSFTDIPDALMEITVSDLRRRFEQLIETKRMAISRVEPLAE